MFTDVRVLADVTVVADVHSKILKSFDCKRNNQKNYKIKIKIS